LSAPSLRLVRVQLLFAGVALSLGCATLPAPEELLPCSHIVATEDTFFRSEDVALALREQVTLGKLWLMSPISTSGVAVQQVAPGRAALSAEVHQARVPWLRSFRRLYLSSSAHFSVPMSSWSAVGEHSPGSPTFTVLPGSYRVAVRYLGQAGNRLVLCTSWSPSFRVASPSQMAEPSE
jgi:hypothetical protein